jgi:hypothetical protein
LDAEVHLVLSGHAVNVHTDWAFVACEYMNLGLERLDRLPIVFVTVD